MKPGERTTTDGHRVGSKLKLKDDAPHPGNYDEPEEFYAGMQCALGQRDMTLSAFLRVISNDEASRAERVRLRLVQLRDRINEIKEKQHA